MATLEKIRNRAGLLIAVIGLALLAFILGDALNSGSTFWRQSQEVAFNVNGEKVGYLDYQKRIDEMVEVYKMQTGNPNLPEDLQGQIRESVYMSMQQEILLEQTAEKLGITVTSDEIIDLVAGDNPSPMMAQNFVNPETGQFDKSFALNFIKAMEDEEAARATGLNAETLALQHAYWSYMKRSLRVDRLRAKITTLMTGALSISELEAKAAFDNEKTTVDIAYVRQSLASVADTLITVTDAEAKKLYDQRKETWKHDGSRTADLLVVDILPSQEDINEVETIINGLKEEFATSENVGEIVSDHSDMPYLDFYVSAELLDPDLRAFAESANINEVNGPIFKDNTFRMMRLLSKKVAADSVSVSLISIGDVADDTNVALADSLLDALKKGSSFETIARDFSRDQYGQQGGALGWLTEGSATVGFGAEFRDFVFSAPVGQAQSFKFRNNLFIVRVTEKSKPTTMYKLGDIVMTVSPSSRTQTALYNDLTRFIAQNNDVVTLSQVAAEAGYNVIPAVTLTSSSQTAYNMPATRTVVRWVFNAKKGAISEVFECNDKFVVAAVTEISKKGYRPFNEVKESLISEVRREKKGEKIVADLKDMSINDLDEYGRRMGSSVDTIKYVSFGTSRLANIGMEPKLNAAITLLPENTVSEPIAGNNNVYVMKVYNRAEKTTEFNAAAEVERLTAGNAQLEQRVGYQFMQVLQKGASIDDNRIRFF